MSPQSLWPLVSPSCSGSCEAALTHGRASRVARFKRQAQVWSEASAQGALMHSSGASAVENEADTRAPTVTMACLA
eukprot:15463502-Alexandrium_andersonii.AAC.1